MQAHLSITEAVAVLQLNGTSGHLQADEVSTDQTDLWTCTQEGEQMRRGCCLIFFLGSAPLVCPLLPTQWKLNVSVEKWKI